MNLQSYQRLIIGYHGCDAKVADQVIRTGGILQPSENEYDWLGRGIYFWEFGPERAMEWASEHHREPAVLGALIQLGTCFDLLDRRNTEILGTAFEEYRLKLAERGVDLPENSSGPDRLKRNRDCAMINWLIETLGHDDSMRFQTVRGMFQEGGEAFPGSSIHAKSHIQVAVRDPAVGASLHSRIFQANFPDMKSQVTATPDISEVWKRASKRIRNMSEEESLSIFVNAGILTPKGNVRKRFKKVIVPMKSVLQ